MALPTRIAKLVAHFEFHFDSFKGSSYNETRARIEFIDPFFKELGWDIENTQGFAEAYKDVIHEDAIKVEGSTKAPDYSFRIGGQRKFFLEAKKPSINVKEDLAPAYQLRRYAWNAGLPVSILTDFEEFAIYDTTIRPNPKDKASTARIFYCTFREYEKHWAYIASIFSKDAILKGSFDHFVLDAKKKKGTTAVDKEFLKEMEKWRNDLARNIALRNSIDIYSLNYVVQATIDRILFLRICEDRNIEEYGRLQKVSGVAGVYKQLTQIFEQADQKYNSGLFHFHKEKGIASSPDQISLNLRIDDKVLKDIITALYYPSPYEFSVISADILGNVYEQFLGKVIRLTSSGQAKVDEKPEVKKAGGVYYTPQYIVKYIVANTVSELLKDKTPMMVAGKIKGHGPLRILDPACGSGSFLIYVYQYLLDWHRDWYEKDIKQKGATQAKKWHEAVYQGPGNHWYLTTQEKKRILLNNIFGVDIDQQAVEVTKLNLLLKVLEGENRETLGTNLKLFQERALPDLSQNIKCGNSLIGSDFYSSPVKNQKELFEMDADDKYKINAFDWEKEFPSVFSVGGFDAVIGNPPYVKARDYDADKSFYRTYLNGHHNYETLSNMWDLYIPFMEKGLKLLAPKGRFGMIVPDTIENADYAQPLREWLLKNFHIYQIDFFPESKIFYSQKKVVGIKNTILFVTKGQKQSNTKRIFHEKDYTKISKTDEADHNLEVFHQNKLAFDLNRAPTEQLGNICFASYGLRLNSDKADKKFKFKKSDLLSAKKTAIHKRKFTEGKFLSRYKINHFHWLEWDTERCPDKLVRPTFNEMYEVPKILLGRQTKVAVFDDSKMVVDNTIIVCTLYFHLAGVNNGNIRKYFQNLGIDREKLEKSSQSYDLHFILGILNSRIVCEYIKYLIQNGIDMYPDDWKKIPVPKVSPKEQAVIADKVKELSILMSENPSVPDLRVRLERQIKALDREIDELVYKAYQLTEKEVQVIEGLS